MADKASKKRKSIMDYFPSTKPKTTKVEPMDIDEEIDPDLDAKEQSPEKKKAIDPAKEPTPPPKKKKTPPAKKKKASEKKKAPAKKKKSPPAKKTKSAPKKKKSAKKKKSPPPKKKKSAKKKKSPPAKKKKLSGIKKKKKNAFELLKKAARKKTDAAAKRRKEEASGGKKPKKKKRVAKIIGQIHYEKYGKVPLLKGSEIRWALRPPTAPKELEQKELLWQRKNDYVYDRDVKESFDIPCQSGPAGKISDVDKKKAEKLGMLDRFKVYRESSQYTRDTFRLAPLLDMERDNLGFDPRYSVKDVPLAMVGNIKKTPFTKQNMKLHWPSYLEARKKQYHEISWELQCDPSAQIQLHHPEAQHHPVDFECILKRNPAGMDLVKEFGPKVEFIYISPPWDITYWGNGVKGFFTLDHLKKLNLRSVMQQGFVFMWAPFAYYKPIMKIMMEKGFGWADSVAQVGCTLHKKVVNIKRNPWAEKSDYAGRMSGIKFHGFLFKCYERNTEGNWVIGNQIQKDIVFTRVKTDPESGQFRYDHSYVYELFQRIVAVQPEDGDDSIQAVHLYCDTFFRHKHWMGVMHHEDPAWVEECGLEPDLSFLERILRTPKWDGIQVPFIQKLFSGPDGAQFVSEQMDIEEEIVESKV